MCTTNSFLSSNFPQMIFFSWKHFAIFLCSRQAFSAASKICYNSTEDERNSFPEMCSQFFYPKHFLGLKTRMKYSNFIQVCQFLQIYLESGNSQEAARKLGKKKKSKEEIMGNEKLGSCPAPRELLQIWSLSKSLDLEHLWWDWRAGIENGEFGITRASKGMCVCTHTCSQG